jgi:hypothetical protein
MATQHLHVYREADQDNANAAFGVLPELHRDCSNDTWKRNNFPKGILKYNGVRLTFHTAGRTEATGANKELKLVDSMQR